MFKNFWNLTPKHTQPSTDQMRAWGKDKETTTKYGSAAYFSEIKSRSGKFTSIVTADKLETKDIKLLEDLKQHLESRTLIQVDRVIAQGSAKLNMRVIIPIEYAYMTYGWSVLLFDEGEHDKVDILSIVVPDWQERRVLVDPETYTNIICGTDYIGEIKKSGLRLAMYDIKTKGGLGLHAGSKLFIAKNHRTGKMQQKGCLFFGLSGTGKTTLVCHDCNIAQEEGQQVILQDDVLLLDKSGKTYGTEDNFYVKTIGVTRESQELIYDSLMDDSAILENVVIKEDGEINFMDDKYTSNCRAVILRNLIKYTQPDLIDLEKIDRIFFITRNALMPPIARLSFLQTAKYFMLGETVETGAGDPDEIGQAKRVVGFSPFIIGPPGDEGNRFFDLISNIPDVKAYVINSGEIEGSLGKHDIKLSETTGLINQTIYSKIEWEQDELTGLEVPKDYNLHRDLFAPGEFEIKWQKIEADRKQYLEQFPKLRPEIKTA